MAWTLSLLVPGEAPATPLTKELKFLSVDSFGPLRRNLRNLRLRRRRKRRRRRRRRRTWCTLVTFVSSASQFQQSQFRCLVLCCWFRCGKPLRKDAITKHHLHLEHLAVVRLDDLQFFEAKLLHHRVAVFLQLLTGNSLRPFCSLNGLRCIRHLAFNRWHWVLRRRRWMLELPQRHFRSQILGCTAGSPFDLRVLFAVNDHSRLEHMPFLTAFKLHLELMPLAILHQLPPRFALGQKSKLRSRRWFRRRGRGSRGKGTAGSRRPLFTRTGLRQEHSTLDQLLLLRLTQMLPPAPDLLLYVDL
mmetsp:Transcript_34124/g.73855  ORF Transcript_34124/g.73855 Transcript_34124/m.73855 type:complete len:302 (+) Transcript_34124:200-1105(+)